MDKEENVGTSTSPVAAKVVPAAEAGHEGSGAVASPDPRQDSRLRPSTAPVLARRLTDSSVASDYSLEGSPAPGLTPSSHVLGSGLPGSPGGMPGMEASAEAELIKAKLALATSDLERQELKREVVRLQKALKESKEALSGNKEAVTRSSKWMSKLSSSPIPDAAAVADPADDAIDTARSSRGVSGFRRFFSAKQSDQGTVTAEATLTSSGGDGGGASDRALPRADSRRRAHTTGTAADVSIDALSLSLDTSFEIENDSDTIHPDVVWNTLPPQSVRRRAFRRALSRPLLAHPLGDADIMAQVCCCLTVDEIAKIATVTHGWHCLLNDERLTVWKKIARCGTLEPKARGWLWREALRPHQRLSAPVVPSRPQRTFERLSRRLTMTPSPLLGLHNHMLRVRGAHNELKAAEVTIFEEFCRCSAASELATASVAVWRERKRDLEQAKRRLETMLSGAVTSDDGSLSPDEAALWTSLRSQEEVLARELAAAQAHTGPAAEIAAAACSDALEVFAAQEDAVNEVAGFDGLLRPGPTHTEASGGGIQAPLDLQDDMHNWYSPFNQIEADVWRTYTEDAVAAAKVRDRKRERARSIFEDVVRGVRSADGNLIADAPDAGPAGADEADGAEPPASPEDIAASLNPPEHALTPKMTRLKRVLAAYAAFDRETGYCQGMNFLAATLLRHMDDCDTFWTLANLLQSNLTALASMYRPGLQRVGLCFFQLSHLLHIHLPRLHAHLQSQGVTPEMYAPGWFMTLFCNDSLPQDTAECVWDLFVLDGWKALHRVVLAIMYQLQPLLLGADFATTVQVLLTIPSDCIPPSQELLDTCMRFKVTNRQLTELTAQYVQTMAILEEDGVPASDGDESDGKRSESAASADEAAITSPTAVAPTSTRRRFRLMFGRR